MKKIIFILLIPTILFAQNKYKYIYNPHTNKLDAVINDAIISQLEQDPIYTSSAPITYLYKSDAENRFNQIAIDTTTLDSNKVSKFGDIMTGNLQVPQVLTSTITFSDGTILTSTKTLSAGGSWVGNAESDLNMNNYNVINFNELQTSNDYIMLYRSYGPTLVSAPQQISIGIGTKDNYYRGIGIGFNAYNNSNNGIGIGESAYYNSNNGIGIGMFAYNNSNNGIGIGRLAFNNCNYAIGIGYYSQSNKPYSTSVGGYTYSASSSVSLGWVARSEQVDSVSLGAGAKTTAPKSVSIGAYTINNDTGTIKLGVGTNIPRDYIEMGKSDTSQATYIMLKSPNGTTYYFWINDDGTAQITTSKP